MSERPLADNERRLAELKPGDRVYTASHGWVQITGNPTMRMVEIAAKTSDGALIVLSGFADGAALIDA